jgi:hypothetical protein
MPATDRVAVLTPAIPERLASLTDTVASVNAQRLRPVAHLIGVDHERAGCALNQNRLLVSALALEAVWVALLADDDVFLPHHLETLVAHSADADIVYSYCDVVGRPGWNPNAPFDADRLRRGNYIPSTALIRAPLAAQLGGWRTESAHGFEDWDFWLRALDAGARFVCVPEVTWVYRFDGSNISWGSPHA